MNHMGFILGFGFEHLAFTMVTIVTVNDLLLLALVIVIDPIFARIGQLTEELIAPIVWEIQTYPWIESVFYFIFI